MQEINNIIPNYSDFCLYKSVKEGDMESLRSILSNNDINVNQKDYYRLTPLHHAILNTHLDVVKLLLSYPNINVNEKDTSHKTPLHFAVEKRNIEIVTALLSVPSILVNKKDKNGSTALHIATSEKNGIEVVNALLRSPDIDVHQKDNSKKTPLELAVKIGYIGAVKSLLDIPGIFSNAPDNYAQKILKYAIENNQPKCITLLEKAMNK